MFVWLVSYVVQGNVHTLVNNIVFDGLQKKVVCMLVGVLDSSDNIKCDFFVIFTRTLCKQCIIEVILPCLGWYDSGGVIKVYR